jgi:hypothetical protein
MNAVTRFVLSIALCSGLASSALAGGLSTKTYSGARRVSTAANGGAANFFNKRPGLAKALYPNAANPAIKSRNIKITEVSRTQVAGGGVNIKFEAATIKKINGAPAATTTVTVADRSVTGPNGGTARQARFFSRSNANAGVDVNPALGI